MLITQRTTTWINKTQTDCPWGIVVWRLLCVSVCVGHMVYPEINLPVSLIDTPPFLSQLLQYNIITYYFVLIHLFYSLNDDEENEKAVTILRILLNNLRVEQNTLVPSLSLHL